MQLKLVKEDDLVLRKDAEYWDFDVDGSPEKLVKEMTRLMFIHGGIGLAAPQCEVSKRVFIMGNQDHLVACINPVVLSYGQEFVRDQEGCLSFPNLWLYVERPLEIVVEYFTVNGEKVQQQLYGLMARVYQHELDHLSGICFDTKVGSFALKRAKDKRKKLR